MDIVIIFVDFFSHNEDSCQQQDPYGGGGEVEK